MDPERWNYIRNLFHEVMHRQDRERKAFLEAAVGTDEHLFRQVWSLVQADSMAATLADTDSGESGQKTVEQATAVMEDPLEPVNKLEAMIPTRIGPYVLAEPIGEGGMGSVYLARQAHPVKRTVAVKILKTRPSKRSAARFEAECQALALLSHSCIAKVFDAGTTDNGLPYFVMEYLPGNTLNAYCDSHKLDLNSRIQLLIKVCEAVHYAHQKGIIHRDLKPSNVLVVEENGRPLPKVIDFGLAKALENKLTQVTLNTRAGALLGTPAYMSPEQVGKGAEVDARTDVYALGMLIYEVLSGHMPLGANEGGLYTLLSRILNDPPIPMADHLEENEDAAKKLAENRRTTLGELKTKLKGELQALVNVALEKQPVDRYQSAHALAEDLQAYLASMPLVAMGRRKSYIFSKFVWRHRLAMALSVLALAGLLVGFIFALRAYIHAEEAAQFAQIEAQKASAASAFLENILASADPEIHGPDISMVSLINQAAADLDQRFKNYPLLEAKLRKTIGTTYLHLGENQKAAFQLQTAADLMRGHLGIHDPTTMETHLVLADYHSAIGDFRKAFQLAESVFQLAAQLPQSHPTHQHALITLARCEADLGNFTAAKIHYRMAIQRFEEPNAPERMETYAELARLELRQGHLFEAQNAFQTVYETYKKQLGFEHPKTLAAADHLAKVWYHLDKLPEAKALSNQILKARQKVFGHDHHLTMNTEVQTAIHQIELGQPLEAATTLQKVYRNWSTSLGESHPRTIELMAPLADALFKSGKGLEAEQIASERYRLAKTVHPPGHPEILNAASQWASILEQTGRAARALTLHREVLEEAIKTLDNDNWHLALYQLRLGKCLAQLGRYEEAEIHKLAALEAMRKVLGEVHRLTLETQESLENMYKVWKKS